MDVIIPTHLVYVLFDPAIPTSWANGNHGKWKRERERKNGKGRQVINSEFNGSHLSKTLSHARSKTCVVAQ